jgi:hypothetical protein
MPYLGWSRRPRPKVERRPPAGGGGGGREPDPSAWEPWWRRGEAGGGGHGWGWGGGRAATHVTTATGEAGVLCDPLRLGSETRLRSPTREALLDQPG